MGDAFWGCSAWLMPFHLHACIDDAVHSNMALPRSCTRYILAFGLFGFAGGVTNWLAITMLFEEVPGLYGSGIIPKQFKQIKATLKLMIMYVNPPKTCVLKREKSVSLPPSHTLSPTTQAEAGGCSRWQGHIL